MLRAVGFGAHAAAAPGQVYIPLINYLLMTLWPHHRWGTFKTSVNIGKAYGAAKRCGALLVQQPLASALPQTCCRGHEHS